MQYFLPDSPEACPYEEPATVQKSAILAVGTAVPGCPHKGCEFAGDFDKNAAFSAGRLMAQATFSCPFGAIYLVAAPTFTEANFMQNLSNLIL